MSSFLYQKHGRYFAQVAHGLRELAADELDELGAEKTGLARGGLHVHADQATAYRLLYRSRLISRLLAPLITFDCHSDKYLYRTAQRIDWPALFGLDDTFSVTANVGESAIKHSLFAAQRLKDAVVDRFRADVGARPSVDAHQADVVLNLHVWKNRATISLDLGSGSLHRRGYRVESGEAPMQETVAAAILRLSGWKGEQDFLDPMCGSGTLVAEAWMRSRDLAAGMLRPRWGVTYLPDFCEEAWSDVQRRPRTPAGASSSLGKVAGSDRDPAAIERARANVDRLPGAEIALERRAFQALDPIENTTIVTNPPYGLRLDNPTEAGLLMKEFGDFLKQKCRGSTAWVYFGQRELMKSVGLRTAAKIPLRTGGLDGRLAKYELW